MSICLFLSNQMNPQRPENRPNLDRKSSIGQPTAEKIWESEKQVVREPKLESPSSPEHELLPRIPVPIKKKQHASVPYPRRAFAVGHSTRAHVIENNRSRLPRCSFGGVCYQRRQDNTRSRQSKTSVVLIKRYSPLAVETGLAGKKLVQKPRHCAKQIKFPN